MRARFDAQRNHKDMRVAKKLLEEGERELWLNRHPQPKLFPYSPGGVCYERTTYYPDVVLDFWHPLEKAQFPYYFAKREQRKKEMIEYWESTYGKPAAGGHH